MIKILIVLILICLVTSCQEKPNKVLIVKQWHLAAKIKSTDIEASKLLDQYTHQKDLYNFLLQKLDEGYETIIAEGCEGKIDASFSKSYNGWDFKKLAEYRDTKEYVDIITMAPLKVKVAHPSANVICGDNDELIKLNQLAMSDMRGFLGFYIGVQTRKDPKYIRTVKEALESLGHGNVENVPQFLQQKLLESWDKSFEYIYQRNDRFIEKILAQKSIPPIVVIGGIHVEDLAQKLASKKIPFEIATPKDYPAKDEQMIHSLGKLIQKIRNSSK